ncbi:MAG: HD domain-containing protein [Gammaproteobacteria bacterium]
MTPTQHTDRWSGLNQANSVSEKLRFMHGVMQGHMPFITRIAVALYDDDTDYLRTFAYSSYEDSPLTHYHARLEDCVSLKEIVASGLPRVVNDLSVYNAVEHEHTRIIYASGYRSSYTVPMVWDGRFFGFIFFNSNDKDVFTDRVLGEVDVIAHMITLLVYNERANVRTMMATIKSALDMTHSRDPETGCHLERMSRYARMIARKLAPRHGFDDQFIEHVFLFAPLHDLGKLAIPDRILLKEGPLTDEEFAIMRTHSLEGRKMIDKLLDNYGLNGVTHVNILRNIALHHHEALDGSGYPDRLKGEAIPIEARIVTVADVFDALTSRRPYKEAWSNAKAFSRLRSLAGVKLDAECVHALIDNEAEVLEIQQAFRENPFG